MGGRPDLPIALKALSLAVVGGSALLLCLMHSAIAAATPKEIWPNSGSLKWNWPRNCNVSEGEGPPTPAGFPHQHPAPAERSANFFTLHMYLMTLAVSRDGLEPRHAAVCARRSLRWPRSAVWRLRSGGLGHVLRV